jgi:hypothetical protein
VLLGLDFDYAYGLGVRLRKRNDFDNKIIGRIEMNKGSYRSALKQKLLATICWSGRGYYFCAAGATALSLIAAPNPARALNLYDGSNGGNNLEINLTTTLSYTGTLRVNSPSTVLKLAEDGDANFQHGIVGNLFSAVPVLDVRDGDFGAHFSGQLYLNTPYLGTNQNDLTPYSSAIYTAKQTDFPSGTRNADGENAQILDAFVFGQHAFADDQTIQLKVGRSVLFWGQSLFFPTDGISGGQAPINVVSAQNLINPQAQQVFMPVGQAILTYQPRPGTTIQGYYQFEWEHDYFQGEGAYFNSVNVLDKGAGWIGLGAECGSFGLAGVNCGLTRTKDIVPEHQNGQFGLSLQQQIGTWDLGAYVERFDAKAPEVGVAFSGASPVPIPGANLSAQSVGNYNAVYPRDIWLEGASFSTNVGSTNLAGEFSVRQHQPLAINNGGVFVIAPGQNTNNNPGYPVGDTWDAQLSTLYITPGVPLDPGGITISGEIILNHLIKVTQNRELLAQGGQATAGAFDLSVTPTYNDVLPGLQVTFPVSINYNYLGRSDVDSGLYHGTGVFDAGVAATYEINWIASLSYQDYLGKPDVAHNGLADRGFVSLNLQHTF